MEWQKFFSDVPDFRINRRKLHLLEDILMLSLCAVLSGAEDFEDIEEYGHQKQAFLKTFLELPHGIPSHDTINRVFRHIDSTKFSMCLTQWSSAIVDFMDLHQISIDGKVLPGSNTSGRKKGGICLVSAWACEQGLSLGQVKVADKSNEKTAIPALIDALDLTGALVSIDAIATTQAIAEQIVGKEGDYLLALKKNQKTAFAQVEDWFLKFKGDFDKDVSMVFGSGRIEERICYVCPYTDFIDSLANWQGIKTLVLVESKREKNGIVETEKRYYISSLEADSKQFNQQVRQHWAIENGLHWHLDVSFREDQSRTRKDNAPENMATLRKISLQALTQFNDKLSIKSRRKKAGWNDDYLKQILQNMRF